MTPDNKLFLDKVVEQDYFKDNISAFRFFVTYGLSEDLIPSDNDLSLNRTEDLFDARVEKYLDLRDIIQGIFSDEKIANLTPVRVMNALAHLGIEKIIKEFWNDDSKTLDMENLFLKI